MGLSNYIPSSRLAQSGVCTSSTRPASPFEGQMIFETDTHRVLIWDNAAWVMIADTDEPPGLQLISTTTIGSGVTSVPVNNCFPSTYSHFKIVIDNTDTNNTASHDIQLQGISTSTYLSGGNFMSWGGAGITGYGPAFNTTWIISANCVAGTATLIEAEIWNPNNSRRKFMTGRSMAGNGHFFTNHLCTSSTVATGFTLGKSGNTMTGGTIRVYGYRE